MHTLFMGSQMVSRVFSNGDWVYAETGETFNEAELDKAAAEAYAEKLDPVMKQWMIELQDLLYNHRRSFVDAQTSKILAHAQKLIDHISAK